MWPESLQTAVFAPEHHVEVHFRRGAEAGDQQNGVQGAQAEWLWYVVKVLHGMRESSTAFFKVWCETCKLRMSGALLQKLSAVPMPWLYSTCRLDSTVRHAHVEYDVPHGGASRKHWTKSYAMDLGELQGPSAVHGWDSGASSGGYDPETHSSS